MDAANLPDAPTSPKRPVFAAGGLIFGLALGLAIVALLEYRNTVLRNERDIWAFTKLPTLATVSLIGSVDPAEFKAVRYIKGFLRRRKPSDPKVDSPLIRAGS